MTSINVYDPNISPLMLCQKSLSYTTLRYLGGGWGFVDEEGIYWNTKEKVWILNQKQSVSRHFVAECRFGVVSAQLYYCTGGAEH